MEVLNLFLISCVFSYPAVVAKWGQGKISEGKKQQCENGHCYQQCYPTPYAMEGPFYLPNQPFRSDIREGREGIPLQLDLIITDFDKGCKPVLLADVHVWQPDALGVYSAYSGYYPLGQPGSKQITGDHAEPTDTATFLRGIQKTNEHGKTSFQSIYPGWYLHRAVHIHFKVFVDNVDVYTGEVYFPDKISDQVAKVKPYSDQTEIRAENDEDWLFLRLDGERSVANITGDVNNGFIATLNVVIELP